MTNRIEQSNWSVSWRLTESAGIGVYLCDYRGRRVLWEGSMPYVTVDHQREVDVESETVGAHGTMWSPLGRHTLLAPVRVNEFRGGFELGAEFGVGSFRYSQMWRFHEDGKVQPWLTIHGTGLHENHTYHPHWRLDFDLGATAKNRVEQYMGGKWTVVDHESWLPAGGEADADGAVWRQVDRRTGAKVNIRPHSLEDAEVFAMTYRIGDPGAITPRASAIAGAYPAAHLASKKLEAADWVLWYVAHIHYQDAFPFTAGAWINVAS